MIETRKKRLMSCTMAAVITAAFGVAGCGGGGGGSGGEGATLSFVVPLVAGQPATASLTLTDADANTLVLDSVELVLREIEFERVEATADCDDDLAGSDDCEEFETDPVLVSLSLDGSMETAIEATVPAGLYDEVEFELHKLSGDDAEDSALLAADPSLDGISVRVRGSFNGTSFEFTSDLMDEQEVQLVPPLEVVDGVPVNVTMTIDVATWFIEDGSTLIDPATANDGGPNESLVENNIKDSLDLFEDDDLDGEPDDD